MSTFLDLVNKALAETSAEQNPLTLLTWDNVESNRRLYPRMKRLVSEAWKMIQMDRDEWEFKSKELTTLIVPRMKVTFGSQPAGISPVGVVFTGTESGFTFTVTRVLTESGDFLDGDFFGQLEITSITGSPPIQGEVIMATVGPNVWQFNYAGPGSYDLTEIDPTLREINWGQAVATNLRGGSIPLYKVPFHNYYNKTEVFGRGQMVSPGWVTEDTQGKIAFQPNFSEPFRLTLIYDTAPQILTSPTDVPFNLKEEYHDWIAWQAVLQLALFDKNSQLASYASTMTDFYSRRAEKELLPTPRWGYTNFD